MNQRGGSLGEGRAADTTRAWRVHRACGNPAPSRRGFAAASSRAWPCATGIPGCVTGSSPLRRGLGAVSNVVTRAVRPGPSAFQGVTPGSPYSTVLRGTRADGTGARIRSAVPLAGPSRTLPYTPCGNHNPRVGGSSPSSATSSTRFAKRVRARRHSCRERAACIRERCRRAFTGRRCGWRRWSSSRPGSHRCPGRPPR